MYHRSSGGVGLDQLWPVGLDGGDWWILDFGFRIGVGLDRLWLVGLDRRWVLAWFKVGIALMVIFFFFLAWFEIGIVSMW